MKASFDVTVIRDLADEIYPRNHAAVATMTLEPHNRLTVDITIEDRAYRFAVVDLSEALRQVRMTP